MKVIRNLRYQATWVLVLIISACGSYTSETKLALENAGDNREELERVLTYYNEIDPNPKKLRAAEFLISNMVYHYSNFGAGVDSLDKAYEYTYGVLQENRIHVFNSDSINNSGKMDAEFDVKRLTSDYIINEIESAFITYNKYEWAKWYPFEMFCEYILPYKIGHSDTTNWRDYARQRFGPLLNYSDFEGPDSYYEAEENYISKAVVQNLTGASGHKVVRVDENVYQRDFQTTWEGYQLFNLHYINGSPEGSTIEIEIDGEVIGDFIFPSTGEWDYVNLTLPPVSFTVNLDSGNHTLRLKSLDNPIFLDFLYIPEYIYMALPQSAIAEGRYILRNSEGIVVLDSLVNEASLGIEKNPHKDWPVSIIPKEGNLYQLAFEEGDTRKALDAFPYDDSDWVIVYNDHGYQNQQWAFIPQKGGGYQIRNKETGKILAVRESDNNLVQIPIEFMKDEYIWYLEPYDSLDSIDIPIRAAQKISEITNRFHWFGSFVGIGPVGPKGLLDYAYGSCVEETNYQTMILRSLGVASAVDYVINYPERNAGHTWSVIFDSKGNMLQNNCHNPVGAETWVEKFAKGKVYRQTYSINHDGLFMRNNGIEQIPPQFMSPYFEDVTHEYRKVKDVEIDVLKNEDIETKYGYLMVFNNDRWVVIGWGSREDEKVIFDNVEPRGMFLPAFYQNGSFIPFNDPFYFDSLGNIHHVRTEVEKKNQIVLKRKHPNWNDSEDFYRLIRGGVFEAANNPDFSDAVTIGAITDDMLDPIFHEINVTTKNSFKYVRYIGPNDSRCNINELVFFDEAGDSLEGEIIGTDSSFENSGMTKDLVFDGDVLTYFNAPDASGSWVGLKFNSPKKIGKIRFVTRNDGNMIEVGDDYELVYWNDDEWISLGKQTGKSDSLIFEGVPTNGLYWLKNHTKGWMERIFTLDNNDQQVWW